MTNVFKQIKFIIENVIFLFLFLLLSLLPINLVSVLGGYILKYSGPMFRSHKIALSNFKKIYNDLNDNQIKIKVKKSWENLGKTLFEFSILEKLVDKKNNKITISGLENIETVIKNKEQVIFFSIHQSNWEILLPVIDQLGINIVAIYRHINNKFIDRLVLKKRNQTITQKKSFYTPKGKESAKDMLFAIKNDSSLVLLIDQKDTAGIDVKLFNKITKTQTGFLKIARKHNLKLIPVKNTRYNINNFSIKFYPPIKPFEKNKSDAEAMLYIHKIIEEWILENPTQWLWQHNRFN